MDDCSDCSVLNYNRRLYEQRLRAMGFHCETTNEWGSHWHRHRDGATACMRRGSGYIPTLRTHYGRKFSTAETIFEHIQLRNEAA